jgi:hypothetical protein
VNPFKGENFKEILRANRDCRIDYNSSCFDNKDLDSKFIVALILVVDLIKKMLVKDPE